MPYPNSTEAIYTYNGRNWLTQLTNQTSGGTVNSAVQLRLRSDILGQ